jgi:hypothetical protein
VGTAPLTGTLRRASRYVDQYVSLVNVDGTAQQGVSA